MSSSALLFGVLPLVIFVLIDSFAGLKSGLLAAILFAVGELIYTLVVYKTIDELTIGSTVLVLIFGFLSFKANKDIYFKLQPVFLGLLFGLVLLVMQMLGKPLLVSMTVKYQFMFPENMREMLLSPSFLEMLGRLSGVLAWGFLIHAALIAYAAFRLNKWWWLLIRGIGLYVMMFLCMLWVRWF